MKSFGIAVLLTAAAMSLGSCTARYQDILRDRDAQISDLQGEVADLRATNADLERSERVARDALAATPKEASAGGATSELERVQGELADLEGEQRRAAPGASGAPTPRSAQRHCAPSRPGAQSQTPEKRRR